MEDPHPFAVVGGGAPLRPEVDNSKTRDDVFEMHAGRIYLSLVAQTVDWNAVHLGND